ncbi:ABC transporter permease [Microbacterium sp. NPDC055312]
MATLFALWLLGAFVLPGNVLPDPFTVGVDMVQITFGTGEAWSHIAATLIRVLIAFGIGLAVATAVGLFMGLNAKASAFFELWIVVGMILPSLVIVILTFMILGLNELGTVVAGVLTTVAMTTVNVWEGAKGLDSKLIVMARSLRVPRWRIVRQIIIPQLAPTLMGSARFSLGLVWKLILFIELLGRSSGVGYQINHYYELFNMTRVLSYSLVFLAVMLFLELGVLGFIERRLFRWRTMAQL